MNYEFHVGDYVETRDGKVGYIYYFRPNVLVFKTQDGGQYEISTDVLDWSGHPENVFKRIGTYDFTKKEKKPIKKLNLQSYLSTQTVASVINELVDAVNLLLDKSTES